MSTRFSGISEKDKALISLFKSLDFKAILKGADEQGTPYLNHIYRLHKILFGVACSACPTKLRSYINNIKNYKIKMENKINGKYKLKKGVVIPVLGTSEAYSEYNLTDDVAIKLLSENKHRSILFAELPTGWEKEIEATEARGETKAKAKTEKTKEIKK